jgi:4-diphosphocytidyl-2C-methyl-D-erythritol kinase
VLLLLPNGVVKESTGAVYGRFAGDAGFPDRRDAVLDLAHRMGRPRELAELPPNDLAQSPLAPRLLALGAFRADVSGAGPAVYGLFDDRAAAEQAAGELTPLGEVWIANPAW